MKEFAIDLPHLESVATFAKAFAKVIPPGAVIYLHGELGAGKTTLVRCLLHELGYEQSVVSPTYTLVEPYELASFTVYHFDLYRLKAAEELIYLGFREYFNHDSVCLVEWPERGNELLPEADINCYIDIHESSRLLRAHSGSKLGNGMLISLFQELEHE